MTEVDKRKLIYDHITTGAFVLPIGQHRPTGTKLEERRPPAYVPHTYCTSRCVAQSSTIFE